MHSAQAVCLVSSVNYILVVTYFTVTNIPFPIFLLSFYKGQISCSSFRTIVLAFQDYMLFVDINHPQERSGLVPYGIRIILWNFLSVVPSIQETPLMTCFDFFIIFLKILWIPNTIMFFFSSSQQLTRIGCQLKKHWQFDYAGKQHLWCRQQPLHSHFM